MVRRKYLIKKQNLNNLFNKYKNLFEVERNKSKKKYYKVQKSFLDFCIYYGLDWKQWKHVAYYLKLQFKEEVFKSVEIQQINFLEAKKSYGKMLKVSSLRPYFTYISDLFISENVKFDNWETKFISKEIKRILRNTNDITKKAKTFSFEETKMILNLEKNSKTIPLVMCFIMGINLLLRPFENIQIEKKNVKILNDKNTKCKCKN